VPASAPDADELAEALAALQPAGRPTAASGPADAMERLLAARSVDALPAVALDVLRERSRADVDDVRALAEDAGGPVRIGLPAGDLDGDGVADALLASTTPGTTAFRLDGARGFDAAPLWSRAFVARDLVAVSVPDQTGDARADVLVYSFLVTAEHSNGGCFEVGCVIQYTASYRWGIELVSGTDGSTAWARTYPGSITLEYVDVLGGVVESYNATNLTVFPFFPAAGDPGVVIDAYDAQLLGVALLVESRGELVRGSDGATLVARRDAGRPNYAILEPVGDLAGSPAGDVAWEVDEDLFVEYVCVHAVGTCTRETRMTVEAIDGASLATAWAIVDDGLGLRFTVPTSADLDGDGLADLFVLRETANGPLLTISLLSGVDGSTAWTGPAGTPLVIGDVDGGAGTDFAIVRESYDGLDRQYEVERYDGATGALLFSTAPFPGEQPNSSTSLFLGGDMDGDGVQDVLVNHLYNLPFTGYRASSLVESGRTGAVVLLEDGPGIVFESPLGDVDGDGTTDLTRITLDFTAYPVFTLTIETRRMTDATSLWTLQETYPEFPGIYLLGAPDLSGAGGDDVLFTVIGTHGAALDTRVRALDGAGGTAMWTVGALPP
jgi:hypothetical protein